MKIKTCTKQLRKERVSLQSSEQNNKTCDSKMAKSIFIDCMLLQAMHLKYFHDDTQD